MFIACLTMGVLIPGLEAADVALTWDPSVTNTDGSLLDNLAGYRLYYGAATRVYASTVEVGLVTSLTVTNLSPDQPVFFAVSAVNSNGDQSDLSAELLWTTPPLALPVDHFVWGPIPSPQTAGIPFSVSLQAKDANQITDLGFTGTVQLSVMNAERTGLLGTGPSSFDYPLHTANHDARTQVIYLTNELGRACTITALALNLSTIPGQTLKQWTLRLKHTSVDSFTKQSVWESTGWTTVYQGDLTVSADGWVEFEFSTPFFYNGLHHLMVDFSFNNMSSSLSGFCRYTTQSKSRTLYKAVNSTYGDPLAWARTTPKPALATARPNTRMKFDDPVSINPVSLSGFLKGAWNGTLRVSGPASGLVLAADDGAGHVGYGNVFDVLASATGLVVVGSPIDPIFIPADSPTGFSDIIETRIAGIPPSVSLEKEDNSLKIGVWGTVGADIQIQVSSNPAQSWAWEPLQDLLLTNLAFSSEGTPLPAPRDTLEDAFIPAFEWFVPSLATDSPSRFFRVVMPYTYAVLADQVLRSKGYHPRLIVARLPGETTHDVCYVGEDEAYIDCTDDRFILALNYSGATIREIADDYGGYVSLNWTSASEFVYTNGARLLIATVVKTDPPASDPPLASTQASGLEIDF
jgi:hypothetical protein